MKCSKYLTLAAAAALLTACSSEEPLAPNGGMPAEVAESDSYALISVAMPDQDGTRAVEFEDSKIESEYKVVNGYMYVFKYDTTDGKTEDDAVYVASASLSPIWSDYNEAGNISRTANYQVAFDKGTFKEGEKYGAVVMLNVGDDNIKPSGSTTFGAWRKSASTAPLKIVQDGKTYLTMTSATMYYASATNKYQTLVEIPADKIKTKKTDLTNKDLIESFYVQRNAAKITFSAPGHGGETVTKNEYVMGNGDKVTVTGWCANVKAKSAFVLQNVKGENFDIADHISKKYMTTDFTPSRINWAEGTSYKKEPANLSTNLETVASVADGFPTTEYVRENTMVAKAMSRDRSTSVLVKGTYMLSGNTTAADIVKMPNGNVIKESDLMARIKALPALSGLANLKVAKKQTAGGSYTLTELYSITYGSDNAAIAGTTLTNTLNQLGLEKADKKIDYYAGGVCYYNIPIKHFGDDETPKTGEITSVDNYDADKHLGRFGVVRNNWYHVVINTISGLGNPDPKPGDTPDDNPSNEKQAIYANFLMLNWAKRTQSEDL